MRRIATPALRILTRVSRACVKSIEIVGSTRGVAERDPGEWEKPEAHRPPRWPAMARVIRVSLIADDAASTYELMLDPLDDLAQNPPRHRQVVSQRPDERQKGQIGLVMRRFPSAQLVDPQQRLRTQPPRDVRDPDPLRLRQCGGHGSERREMHGPRRPLLFPEPTVCHVRNVDTVEIPDQLLNEVEVDEVVSQDPEPLMPAAERPRTEADRVILTQTPQLRVELGAVRAVTRMQVLDLLFGHAVQDPPVDPRLPAQKDRIDQRVDAGPQPV